MIKRIGIDKLREMDGREGLTLQGFGSLLEAWVDGIQEELQEKNILPDGEQFHMIYVFVSEGWTCLLFDCEDVMLYNQQRSLQND